ncbi:armadillo-type protein [Podospora didyma]|uniref:Armadillo-type protein n=1 Tax=Podospora didyma TaxID=330526 RepID=A0AAE0TZ54_9PEZI|nr:armadillo-type protein [Podospora didyma]
MSYIPAELHAELGQLILALQSSDNSTRSQAEEHLQNNWTNPRPETLLMGLAEQIASSPDGSVRAFAAVIFRKIASKTRKTATSDNTDMFFSLEQEQAVAIRTQLLNSLGAETIDSVRNKISDAVAEVARQYSDNNQSWQDLLEALFSLSLNADHNKREAAFRIFKTTPGIIEKVHEEAVANTFARAFKDDVVTVRLSAVEAFAAFFRSLNKKSQTKYHPLIDDILNILPPIKDAQASDNLSRGIMSLIELAEISPRMFKARFSTLVGFSISVIQDTGLDDLCRQNALELMSTFADYAPSMCKKDPNYTVSMITQCLSLMTDLGEDDDNAEEWLANDDLDMDENDQNHVAGEHCMDRLANKLGGVAVLAPTFTWLPRMMQSVAWKDRHAALMAISAISEGCRDQMISELKQVLDLVVPALKDPHPRVRWAGCNALGQMSTDFAPAMQKEYYDMVLSSIIPVLDSPEARVKSHAAAALVNFCEEAEKSVLEPYLEVLLSNLFNLLQNEKRYVQEQALSTIATIADAAEKTFANYYDSLMPLLINVLRGQNEKEFRLLRAKAMECATLIALAVGPERLGGDARMLVELLATIQNSITDADDPQAQYLMHCWGRMCRVMGADFLPYLQTVMPPLLNLASAKADIQLLDDDAEVEKMQQEEGWELVPLRGRTIGIRTSSMEDKNMAIELLVVYAQVLEGNFFPYVAEIMEKIALPGLAFFFHDPVRFVSAKLVPQLLGSYKKHYGPDSNELKGLWLSTVDKLLEVLTAEPAIDTLAEMYQCFYEAVSVIGTACLDAQHMTRFIDAVHSTLEDYMERVAQRAEESENAAAEEVEDDQEELLMAIEDDQTLLSDMNKAFHCIFKYHGSIFLPSWQRLLTIYRSFLQSDDPTQRQWGLCIMDDVLEYCGPDSARYAEYIQPPLLAGCADSSPAIRQAAAYGIGVAAHRGGSDWTQFVGGAILPLFNIMQTVDARSEENVYATENACAAVAKILHYNAAAVPEIDSVIAQWLNHLPVTNDEEAAPYAYAYLTELITKNHPAVISQPAKVFVYVAQALEVDALAGTAANHVIAATKMLLEATGINGEAILQQEFSPEAQQLIRGHFG